MSRLDFGGDTDGMEVTDISTGHFVFTPPTGEKVSLEALREAIAGAGYEIETASLAVVGELTTDGHLIDPETAQRFRLQGPKRDEVIAAATPGSSVRVTGEWSVVEADEVIGVESWELPAGGTLPWW